ncbi:uncharacterized protein RSE6_15030 [Rhynchosporium secalis]|uniref:Uncharacterized protein n=1 Tax=Rhynchosporium secalis TaxID=38038 RepID=A0A1E1MWJ5_RHYSE|nr:uncharacterized protein RSE6_15030 [Rhynchosporium secalis]
MAITIGRLVKSAKLELVLIRILLRVEPDRARVLDLPLSDGARDLLRREASILVMKISASAIVNRLFILLEYYYVLGNSYIVSKVIDVVRYLHILRLVQPSEIRGGITKIPKETKPKGIRNRVAPVTLAARDTRKREVSEKVRKATAEVKKRRSEVAARKRKLDDLYESYSNSSKPEEKAEYENLEAEVTKQDAELIE